MSDPTPLYDLLTELDRLEDLREDLQELALRGSAAEELDEATIDEEMAALGVRTLGEVEARIDALNAQLDRREDAGEDA